MKVILKILLIGSAFFLSACGGGGSSSPSESLVYEGKTTVATLDKASAKEFIQTLAMLSSSDTVDVADSTREKLSGNFFKLVNKANKQINGSQSGTVDVTTQTVNAITTKITVIFKNYNDGSNETLNGTVVYIIIVDKEDDSFIRSMDIDFKSLQIKDSRNDVTMSGLIKMTINDTNTRKTATQNLVAKNNQNNKMLKFENFITVYDSNDNELSYNGKVYDSQRGYVTISTPVELTYNDRGEVESGGEIVYKGKNSTVKERIAYDNTIRVEFDNGSNGTVDEVEVYNIETFEVVANREPIISIVFPQSIYTNTDMDTVKVTIYDPDLDGFERAYVWKVNDLTKSTSMLLSNDLFKKHEVLKLEVTATDNRVGNVKIGSKVKEQEVLNSKPIAKVAFDISSLSVSDKVSLDFLTIYDVDDDELTFKWEIKKVLDKGHPDHEREEDTEGLLLSSSVIMSPLLTVMQEGNYTTKLTISDQDENLIKIFESEVEKINIIDSVAPSVFSENFVSESVQLIDVNKDGYDDIVYLGGYLGEKASLYIAIQNDSNTFEDSIKVPLEFTEEAESLVDTSLGDFNNDGNQDILISWHYSNVTQIISLKMNEFVLIKELNIIKPKVADMNNDNKNDIVAYDSVSGKLTIYTNINDLTSKVILDDVNNKCKETLTLSDINNDGLTDILCHLNKVEEFKDDGKGGILYSGSVEYSYFLQNSLNQFSLVSDT